MAKLQKLDSRIEPTGLRNFISSFRKLKIASHTLFDTHRAKISYPSPSHYRRLLPCIFRGSNILLKLSIVAKHFLLGLIGQGVRSNASRKLGHLELIDFRILTQRIFSKEYRSVHGVFDFQK